MADALSIFSSKFRPYIKTLKDTSYDNENGVNLCQDITQKVFDFDLIVKNIYPSKQPASYDALLISQNTIYCIEFKNQKYSDIDRSRIERKLINGREVLDKIFEENNIQKRDYSFIFCVAYRNSQSKWRRGIEKNEIQFELDSYRGKIYNEIYTNDIQFFTKEYKKYFSKELEC